MAVGILAILDDIATILDDVATQAAAPLKKTAGIIGDDLAVNANTVNGIASEREWPVVLSIFLGSLANKIVLAPLIVLMSVYLPWLITPLLILGGIYLCYEGGEKLFHRKSKEDRNHEADLKVAFQLSADDMLKVERTRIRSAIMTDIILSFEILMIMLSALGDMDAMTKFFYLLGLGVLVTVLIYGFVYGLLRMDDLGAKLVQAAGCIRQRIGGWLLKAMPWTMRLLGIVGAAAMFAVGGGLISHNIEIVHELLAKAHAWNIPAMLTEAVFGVMVGGVMVVLMKFRGVLPYWRKR